MLLTCWQEACRVLRRLAGRRLPRAEALIDIRPGDRIAEELAALRRVAVLVARGAAPEEIFAAVAAEAGRLLGADRTGVCRYDDDKVMTVVARWTAADGRLRDGDRIPLDGRNVSTLVLQTGQPARVDDYSHASGSAAAVAQGFGIRSTVGAPISVEGRLWGDLVVTSTCEEKLPPGTEARVAGFAELAGTAIANAQARMELRGYAGEQAALRRVATLVAREAPAQEMFAAVAAETGQVLSADITAISRYEADGTATVAGLWTRTGTPLTVTVGDRLKLSGWPATRRVFQTSQPTRIDDHTARPGESSDARYPGFRSAVGVPISVGGRLWGVVLVASARMPALPADTEVRLAQFTELVGTAIANAAAQAALAASRARIVTAADEARRRIERNLHDGAQQRLVSLGLRLREAREAAPAGAGELVKLLDGITAELASALEELRETARGIHPAALAGGGLHPALKTLIRRCPVRVDLRAQITDRPPGPVEIAAYYVVSEALANTAKHASASAAKVEVAAHDGVLRVRVCDDGRGGADFGRGSGLVGLKDRVEALGGRISLRSPPGKGTTIEAHIPTGRTIHSKAHSGRRDPRDQ